MPQPFDYSIPLPDPSAGFMAGLKQGMGLQDISAQQQERQAQMQALRSLVTNPNAGADEYARAMTLVPGMAEPLQKAWQLKSADQQQALLSELSQWSAAIQQGQPQVASQMIRAKADAHDAAAGQATREGQLLRMKADAVDRAPDLANSIFFKPLMMAHPQGKQRVDNIIAMGKESRDQQLHPPALAKAKSEAGKADAEERLKWGDVANQQTATTLTNEKTAQEIRRSQLDGQIALLGKRIEAEGEETKRGQLRLERDKLQMERDKLGQTQSDSAQASMDTANAVLEAITRVVNHPGLSTGTGTGSGAMSFFNSSDANDFRKQVAVVKNQSFLAEIAKLRQAGATLGQVTEKEGERLETAYANLDPDQSTSAFLTQAKALRQQTERYIAKLVAAGKLPKTGGAFVLNHPVYGNVTEGRINDLMTKLPGYSREQVINFLQQTSGGIASAPGGR